MPETNKWNRIVEIGGIAPVPTLLARIRRESSVIGKTVSHYKITRELGAGGMGIVYEAVDSKLDRTVALKFLPPESTRDPDAKARFVHEAKAASALDHNNVCVIYEIDETDDGQLFLAMARYEGETLKERIGRGPLPLDDAIDITRQVAEGLAKAHELEIVHRDIKPANIFITNDGVAKILDFGLAKLAGLTQLTQEGTTLGTAHYMSPEQAGGGEVDHRSDLWCLGVCLYEMLTGEVPFPGDNAQAVIYAILNREVPPPTSIQPGLTVRVDSIVGKCLAKPMEDRYQQVTELLDDMGPLAGATGTGSVGGSVSWSARPRRRTLTGTGISVLVVALLGIVVAKVIFTGGEISGDRSIAVLPFKTIVAEPGYEWFSDGMTEAIVGHLTKIKDLKVTSRTSTIQFRDSDLPIGEIAQKLGVNNILEGSVQQAAGRIQIMVKLIDARTDDHVWAEDIERPFKDVFALQTEIALQVVKKLETTLTPEITERIKAPPTRELEAYKLLREGIALWGGSSEDRKLGLEKIEQATRVDPDYAEAYGYLANYSWLSTVYSNLPPAEMFPKAKAYALKALSLDDTNFQAHWALGFVMSWWDRNWAAAERHWQKLLELAPGASASYSAYAWHMLQTGRFEEAIELHKKAVELNPLSAGIHQNVGEIFYYAGRYDEAITSSKETISRFPDQPQTRTILGLAYLGKGMRNEALEALHVDMELSQGLKPEIDNLIGHAFALAGEEANARKILDLLENRYENGAKTLVSMAEIYFALGDKEKGFEYLTKAEEERDPRFSWIRILPVLDDVKDDPRYLDLLEKAGF